MYYLFDNKEAYENLNLYPSRLFFMKKFAKLNDNNKIVSLDIREIKPTFNETQCKIKKCPRFYIDDLTCYKCS